MGRPGRTTNALALGVFGTLDLNGYNLTVDALTSGVITNSSGSSVLTAGSSGGDGIFDGVIADGDGSLALVKTGEGVLTLSGDNTYSDGATLLAGILLVTNTTGSTTGTGNVTLDAGTLGGSGIIYGTVISGSTYDNTIAPSATLDSDATTTLTLGALITGSHTILTFNLVSRVSNGTSWPCSTRTVKFRSRLSAAARKSILMARGPKR